MFIDILGVSDGSASRRVSDPGSSGEALKSSQAVGVLNSPLTLLALTSRTMRFLPTVSSGLRWPLAASLLSSVEEQGPSTF
jgi:hypothetical protein